jgi:hypothetical protein
MCAESLVVERDLDATLMPRSPRPGSVLVADVIKTQPDIGVTIARDVRRMIALALAQLQRPAISTTIAMLPVDT